MHLKSMGIEQYFYYVSFARYQIIAWEFWFLSLNINKND